MRTSVLIVTFMTKGINIYSSEVTLSKKIDLKDQNPNGEREIICRDTSIDDQQANPIKLDGAESIKFSELLNSCIYRELKDRINKFDPEALSIMMAAKQRVKRDLEHYKNTIKYVALALKPFYIVCLISVLIQSPEHV